MRPIFGSVVGFVAVALVGCVTTAPLFKLKAIDREKTTRQYVGKEHVLAVSMSFSDFFGDSSRLFVDARPFEIVKLYHQSGEATVVGVPSESVIPAGTPVRVKEIIFPADPLMAPFESGRPALAPTAHPWLVLERTAGDASALPLVVVLPREVASYDEMTQAIDKVLKSQQWVTVWLTQRGPLELDAIYRKKPMEGMTWPALLAALGEPGNIGDYALGEMMDFVADYGDLQITVQGNVVKSIVSKKAEAEKAQQHALAEAEKARAEAEQRAAEEAAREAEKQAQVAEAKRIRDEESAKERGTVIEARAAAAAAEEARRDAERQAEEDRKTAEQQRLTKDEEAARREVELKARLEAAERARVAAERDREQKLREAELAKKVVEAEAAALAARQKAEEDAARAQASAVESRRRLQSDLAKTEKDAAAADKKAKGLEAKAAAGQREIDAAQVRLAALEASAKERRKLGLKVASVSPQLASTLGRVDTLGAFVAKVESDGPAERAGVKANDIITAVEKKEVLGPKEFVDLVNEIPADRSVNVEVLRGGKTVTLTFTSELAAALAKEAKALTQITARHRPAIEAAASARTEADVKATAVAAIRQQLAAFVPSEPRKIGVNVEIINPQLASALGLSQGQGAFVRAVQAEGDAERGGLQKNDVVLGVNGAAVAGPDQFRDHVGKAMPFEVIELEVLRKGSRVSLKVPASRTPFVVNAAAGAASRATAAPAAGGTPRRPLSPGETVVPPGQLEGEAVERRPVAADPAAEEGAATTPAQDRAAAPAATEAAAAAQASAPAGPEEVLQPGTNKIWLRCPVGMKWSGSACAGSAERRSFADIVDACPSGYRVPNRDDLVSLLGGCEDDVRRGKYGDCSSCEDSGTCAAMFELEDSLFWSRTPSEGSSGYAWYVDLDGGRISTQFVKNRYRVLCLR